MTTASPENTRTRAEILRVNVTRVDRVAEAIHRLTFTRVDGEPFPPWEPGSHVDVIMPEHLRQYSLCSTTDNLDELQVAVLRTDDSRGGSAWVHDEIMPGQQISISVPRNNFPFADSKKYMFIAGGIGITAIMPMLAAAEAAGREWMLYYGGRSRSSMAFADELKAKYGNRVQLAPSDEKGRLDLDSLLSMPRAKMLIYACGPERMLKAIEDWALGWPPGVLHTEHFVAANLDAGSSMEPFEVEMARTRTTVTVNPGTSVLEAIEAVGGRVVSSCRAGVCGTCETDVLAGEVEHRDVVLSPEDRESGRSMMVCVSRAAAGCPVLRLDV